MTYAVFNTIIRLGIAAYLSLNLYLAFFKGYTTGFWKMRVTRTTEPIVFWITTGIYLLTLALMAVALLARHGLV